MTTSIEAIHTMTHDGKPLAIVYGLPGDEAGMNPRQMRDLARALQQAANDCECTPYFHNSRRTVRAYPLAERTTQAAGLGATFQIRWAGDVEYLNEDGKPFTSEAEAREFAEVRALEAGPGESTEFTIEVVTTH